MKTPPFAPVVSESPFDNKHNDELTAYSMWLSSAPDHGDEHTSPLESVQRDKPVT